MSSAFTFANALAGGALIGLAATLLWAVNGRTAGVSGILGGLVRPARGEFGWQAAFVAGLLVAGAAGVLVHPSSFGRAPLSLGGAVLAGLLVGIGTKLGSGCTSGHGVCGISRGSVRSLVATLAFMATAIVTVAVEHFTRAQP
jgi:uncharacterized membrane protein YedE/YeeE